MENVTKKLTLNTQCNRRDSLRPDSFLTCELTQDQKKILIYKTKRGKEGHSRSTEGSKGNLIGEELEVFGLIPGVESAA